MKKNLRMTLVALALAVGVTVSAQEKKVELGVKGGMNISNFSGDVQNTDAKIGFNVGVTLDYAFTNELYLLTGLEFTTKGAKTNVSESEYEYQNGYGYEHIEVIKGTFNPMYLQIPIHIGYKLDVTENTKLVFRAGPYIAYGVGGKVSAKQANEKESIGIFRTGLMKNFDFGLGLGVGAEFGKIGVNLGYDFGIINTWDVNEGSVRNGNFAISLGYKF